MNFLHCSRRKSIIYLMFHIFCIQICCNYDKVKTCFSYLFQPFKIRELNENDAFNICNEAFYQSAYYSMCLQVVPNFSNETLVNCISDLTVSILWLHWLFDAFGFFMSFGKKKSLLCIFYTHCSFLNSFAHVKHFSKKVYDVFLKRFRTLILNTKWLSYNIMRPNFYIVW